MVVQSTIACSALNTNIVIIGKSYNEFNWKYTCLTTNCLKLYTRYILDEMRRRLFM